MELPDAPAAKPVNLPGDYSAALGRRCAALQVWAGLKPGVSRGSQDSASVIAR